MDNKQINIFLVDDDVVFLKSLQIEFQQEGNFNVTTFVSGESCIEAMSLHPDVVVLDYWLDGTNKNALNGIQTLDKLLEFDPKLPVIMLSSQDKIEVAVDCMHHHAFDYVVKSETAFLRLQKIILNVFRYRKLEKQLGWYMERMQQ